MPEGDFHFYHIYPDILIIKTAIGVVFDNIRLLYNVWPRMPYNYTKCNIIKRTTSTSLEKKMGENTMK